MGEVWTEFEKPIETEADLLAALQEGIPRRIGHRNGLLHLWRRRAEFAHLGYENSLKKFDRIVCSGMEATNPRQPAYGGRFEDVAVY